MTKVFLVINIFLIGGFTFSQVGIVDTVGWTTYDFPPFHARRTIVNDFRFGTHITWLADFPPYRDVRYNFFNCNTGRWLGEAGVFLVRTGLPSLHIIPTGEAVVGAHGTDGNSPLRPMVAKDVAPGSGLFPEVSEGPEGFTCPLITVTQNGWIHFAIIDYPDGEDIYYTKIRQWPNWEEPILLAEGVGPFHNITSSLVSNNLIVLWTTALPPGMIDSVAYRISTNGGDTWGPITYIPFPPAFSPGSETFPSFYSIYGFFDRTENFHIVASLYPVIRDTMRFIPAEIWHYCPNNNPAWSKIRRAEPETLAGEIDEVFATRPSIGQNPTTQTLIATWEEFIGSNPEPINNQLRSGIWVSASDDNGRTWTTPRVITDTTATISFRFPCIAEKIDHYAWITYLADSIAGSEMPKTRNPILVHRVPIDWIVGLSEKELKARSLSSSLLISPNPFHKLTTIRLPHTAHCPRLEIYNSQGRLIKSFCPQAKNVIVWNGEDERGKKVPIGIYILKLEGRGIKEREKVIFLW
ncbi:MAG: hypothetical protein ABIL00_05315 [candidate division WOR-3 bacterium]